MQYPAFDRPQRCAAFAQSGRQRQGRPPRNIPQDRRVVRSWRGCRSHRAGISRLHDGSPSEARGGQDVDHAAARNLTGSEPGMRPHSSSTRSDVGPQRPAEGEYAQFSAEDQAVARHVIARRSRTAPLCTPSEHLADGDIGTATTGRLVAGFERSKRPECQANWARVEIVKNGEWT